MTVDTAVEKKLRFARSFLSNDFRYAVVGASNDRNKYGNIVFRDLRDAGLTVVPVNPKTSSVEGSTTFQRLQDIKPSPDVAVVVVPPNVGLSVVDDAEKAGVKRLWFQPGAESGDIVTAAKQWKIAVMADGSCIMVARRLLLKQKKGQG